MTAAPCVIKSSLISHVMTMKFIFISVIVFVVHLSTCHYMLPHLSRWNVSRFHLRTAFKSLRPSDAYICVNKLTTIGSDNGLSPGRHQTIIWTNAGILSIGSLGTNFSENLREIHIFSCQKMHLKMSSAEWRQFSVGLNVLTWASVRKTL